MAASKEITFRIAITTVTLAAILSGVWLTAIYREHDSRAILLPSQAITLLADAKPVTEFSLTDHNHKVFDVSSLKGKWSFLFFGFTHCPDVCPTTLAVLAHARSNIARNKAYSEAVQFVFVSVDPNRDTAGKLRQYVGHFDSAFLGVTGDSAQIANLAGQLRAAYQVMATQDMDNYPVYHTPAVFLLDPRGRYHAIFKPPLDAEAISRIFNVVREIQAGETP